MYDMYKIIFKLSVLKIMYKERYFLKRKEKVFTFYCICLIILVYISFKRVKSK